MDNLLFYDIECFEHDSLIVTMTEDGELFEAPRWNRFDDLYEKVVKGHTLVGYNNYHYDDIMTSVMTRNPVSQNHIWATNNTIINDGTRNGLHVSDNIVSIDTMQQIHVSQPSLKKIEANMGISIKETPIDFTHTAELTESERKEVEQYCCSDVRATIEVYKARKKSYFETKNTLADMIVSDYPKEQKDKVMRWNTTTMSAYFLTGKRDANTKFEPFPEAVKNLIHAEWIPEKVAEMWDGMIKDTESALGKGISTKINAWGCEVVYGMGGLHGAPKKPGRYNDIVLADVGSMYPSIICSLNLLGAATPKYDGIRKERLRIKKTDKVRADALKLVLNSVYGLLKSPYSALYNPMISAAVCIYGQITLTKLCVDLNEAGYRIININTDGVAFDNPKHLDESIYLGIIDDWQNTFKGMTLEPDFFDKWIQKDVNNYVAARGGRIKVKGGEVNRAFEDQLFSNNSCRITQIALVEKLLNDKEPLDTINENVDKPYLFQFILQSGSTFRGTVDEEGNSQQKVNRVFAAKESAPHTKLYKLRSDGGKVNFPDVPERMFVWEGACRTNKEFPEFKKIVDRAFYAELVEDKLKGWPK